MTATQTDGQTEKNGRKQMERERQRERSPGSNVSKQENQRGWVQHMLRQKNTWP